MSHVYNKGLDQLCPNHCMKMISFLRKYEAYKCTYFFRHCQIPSRNLQFNVRVFLFFLFLPYMEVIHVRDPFEGPIRSQSILLDNYHMTEAVSVTMCQALFSALTSIYLVLIICVQEILYIISFFTSEITEAMKS